MAEEKFIPKEGQQDFTNVRWCPVVNIVVYQGDKFLLMKRNAEMRLYPGYWNGISGFLDDKQSLEEKVQEEISEEADLAKTDVVSIELCGVFNQEAPKYYKTWIVHAVRVEVREGIEIKTDWEAETYKWFTAGEEEGYKLLPGFLSVLGLTRKPNRINRDDS